MDITKSFWKMSVNEVASHFNTHIENGISDIEVKERLEEFGRNTLNKAKKVPNLKIFLSQLTSPLIVILIIAGLVTLSISHYRDAIFIFIAVFVNSALGFYQEAKAEKALAELKTYLKQRARVIRDGKEREIDAEEIVPGDIIRLAQGDRVSADARIIYLNDLQIDEAVLTGESLPVSKTVEPIAPVGSVEDSPSGHELSLGDQKSMIFAGTLVTQGVCTAIVCRTHSNTELGKIATLISRSEKEVTPLQKSIKNFSLKASAGLVFLTVIVFIAGILYGYSWLEMFLISVAIAVSAIPEGLPVAMTVILAVGVGRMAKRKGVVRKLIAAEALGSTTVILTDKTGTLTTATMEMSGIIPLTNIDERSLLNDALSSCSVLIENPEENPNSWRMSGKIMETTLVRSSALRGISATEIQDRKHVLQVLPFNAVNKYSVSLIKRGDKQKDEKHFLIFFGAPDILLAHSSIPGDAKNNIMKQVDDLASAGSRVLAIASKEIGESKVKDFSFAKDLDLSHLSVDGLITFRDPIRPQIKDTMSRVHSAGIRTIIMTGDHRGTAVAVAKEIGMKLNGDSVLDASELVNMSEEELNKRMPLVSVISRVTPFDKLRIVKLLQKSGEIVAMTGDGVNDAPSIRQADIGIAMGSGTEVARDVSDLVLLDDNFETIVAAVEEGRQILKNIKKVLVYLLSAVTDGLILIGGSLIMGIPLPLNALQILWVNFFSGSFPAIAFAFEKDTDKLSRISSHTKTGLFDPLMKFLIIFIGVSTSALLFVIYIVFLRLGFDENLVRTFVFAAFGSYTLFVALSVRSLEKSIFSVSLFSNPYLLWGISIGVVLMASAIYIPVLQSLFDTVALPFWWVMGVVAVGALNIALIEGYKWFYRRNNISKFF